MRTVLVIVHVWEPPGVIVPSADIKFWLGPKTASQSPVAVAVVMTEEAVNSVCKAPVAASSSVILY
jgi:hypothetical protein